MSLSCINEVWCSLHCWTYISLGIFYYALEMPTDINIKTERPKRKWLGYDVPLKERQFLVNDFFLRCPSDYGV
jgi:hypothetical protein